jgi:hypothetical protein
MQFLPGSYRNTAIISFKQEIRTSWILIRVILFEFPSKMMILGGNFTIFKCVIREQLWVDRKMDFDQVQTIGGSIGVEVASGDGGAYEDGRKNGRR